VIRVFFTEEATAYLDELVGILLKEEYFSFKATADEYVDDLIDFVVAKIGTVPKRIAPPRFKKFGQNLQYIKCKRNKGYRLVYFLYSERQSFFDHTHHQ